MLWTYYLTRRNMILHSCCDLLVLRNKRIKEARDYYALKPDGAIHACMRSIILACMPTEPYHPSLMSRGVHKEQRTFDLKPLINISDVGHGIVGRATSPHVPGPAASAFVQLVDNFLRSADRLEHI